MRFVAMCKSLEIRLVSLSHDLPQPGLLPKEKEPRAPRLWPNQRRDWPDGLRRHLIRPAATFSPSNPPSSDFGATDAEKEYILWDDFPA
jgi:hypothetical protein